MNIKLKNSKTSIFVSGFLTIICSLFLSCKSSDVENSVFNKIVHPREYYFDISDIDEYPKFKREKDSKSLSYSIDFTDYLKYDLPKAGDKLILKYKLTPNKDVPGSIFVNINSQPEDKLAFVSDLKKKNEIENQVTFTLKNDLEEVIFDFKYDNPEKYLSLILSMEKVCDTTDTKAEKKALEKAEKQGAKIITGAPETNVEETKSNVEEQTPSNGESTTVEEPLEKEPEEISNNYDIIARERRKLEIKDVPFHKIIHPRVYYFDVSAINDSPKLKKERKTGILKCTIDFTKLAKEDLPKAGDKIIFIYTGYSNKDVSGNIYASLENSTSEKRPFSSGIKEKDNFTNKISFILNEDLEKVKLNLVYDNPEKYSSITFSLENSIYSTNTSEEKSALEKAIKQERKIIEYKRDIVDDYLVESEDENKDIEKVIEEINTEQELLEQNSIPVTPIVEPIPDIIPEQEEMKEEIPEEEETKEEEPVIEEPAIEEEIEEAAEAEEVKEPEQEPEIKEEIIEEEIKAPVVVEKTPEELLIEEHKRLEAEQKRLEEEQAKLEAEKARIAAEEKAKKEAEAARIAKEKAEKEAALEAERQKLEQMRQQQMLEDTIESVTNSNVQRYEKEYLNDYAVSGYTFDMEPEQEKNTQIYKNPDERNKFGETLLMSAAKDGNDWKIKALLTSGADVNLKDKDGWTALMYAVRYNGNMNCVELLIEAGADIKAKNNYGTSALVLAANYNSNPEILKELLSYYSPNDKEVLTSFIQVLTENQEDEYMQIIKVNLFLDMSVPLNSLYNGKTPLMYAAESGHSTKVIKLLMENSSTSVRSREGKTAFDYAKENPKLKHDDIYWSLNNR